MGRYIVIIILPHGLHVFYRDLVTMVRETQLAIEQALDKFISDSGNLITGIQCFNIEFI